MSKIQFYKKISFQGQKQLTINIPKQMYSLVEKGKLYKVTLEEKDKINTGNIEELNYRYRSISNSHGEELWGFSTKDSFISALDKINEIIKRVNETE